MDTLFVSSQSDAPAAAAAAAAALSAVWVVGNLTEPIVLSMDMKILGQGKEKSYPTKTHVFFHSIPVDQRWRQHERCIRKARKNGN